MKAKGIHEGCIEQIQRLYADKLFNGGAVPTDEAGRIRVDDWEMRDDVQKEIFGVWDDLTTETVHHLGDLRGYSKDFKNLFGFGFKEVDYHLDVNEMVEIEDLV
jgi:enoyl-[acyl-carrier protein] reductase / trans-2-enoyl-CoA reductase (NAD+)